MAARLMSEVFLPANPSCGYPNVPTTEGFRIATPPQGSQRLATAAEAVLTPTAAEATVSPGEIVGLADLVLALHLGYVAFTVGGEIAVLLGAWLGWRWIRNRAFRLVHLAAVALVAVESLIGTMCPLTVWEYELREASGAGGERIGLVARLIRSVIYYDFPEWFFVCLYVGWTVVVLATLRLVPLARRTSHRTGGTAVVAGPVRTEADSRGAEPAHEPSQRG